MSDRRRSSLFSRVINIWVFAGAVLIACGLSMTLVVYAWVYKPDNPTSAQPNAVMNVIHAPTSTPTVEQMPTETASIQATVNPEDLPPGTIAAGLYVQINGTGGDGLRLRDEPGLSGNVLLLGNEAEVMQVGDGPVEADGYTWWFLVAPYDETRQGWAVADYLIVIDNPENDS
jgi:hypothetical protein